MAIRWQTSLQAMSNGQEPVYMYVYMSVCSEVTSWMKMVLVMLEWKRVDAFIFKWYLDWNWWRASLNLAVILEFRMPSFHSKPRTYVYLVYKLHGGKQLGLCADVTRTSNLIWSWSSSLTFPAMHKLIATLLPVVQNRRRKHFGNSLPAPKYAAFWQILWQPKCKRRLAAVACVFDSNRPKPDAPGALAKSQFEYECLFGYFSISAFQCFSASVFSIKSRHEQHVRTVSAGQNYLNYVQTTLWQKL